MLKVAKAIGSFISDQIKSYLWAYIIAGILGATAWITGQLQNVPSAALIPISAVTFAAIVVGIEAIAHATTRFKIWRSRVPRMLKKKFAAINARWQDIEGADRDSARQLANELFIAEFCPWCAETLKTMGDGFFADPGDPPSMAAMRLANNPASQITGSSHTLEAAKRLVFWCAARHNPSICHRTAPSYIHVIDDWARTWLVIPKQGETGWRTFHQPLNWIRDELV